MSNEWTWHREPVLVFTADVDWASDDAVRLNQKIFDDFDIPLTYFITHFSPYVGELLKERKIEAGIHPNFLPNSSQGSNFTEVIDYCARLLPEAECFRSHRYFDVTDITHELYSRGFRYDANVCTFLQRGVRPFLHESGLIRFPTYFEDGTYLYRRQELDFEQVGPQLFSNPGLMVVSVHPMHMVMNSPALGYSRQVKDSVSREEWNTMTDKAFKKIRYDGVGIRDFVVRLLEYTRENSVGVRTLKQAYEEIREAMRDSQGAFS